MDIAVRRVNSVDTNYGTALKTIHRPILLSLDIIFFPENLQFGYQLHE